jgi:hypothetical protein
MAGSAVVGLEQYLSSVLARGLFAAQRASGVSEEQDSRSSSTVLSRLSEMRGGGRPSFRSPGPFVIAMERFTGGSLVGKLAGMRLVCRGCLGSAAAVVWGVARRRGGWWHVRLRLGVPLRCGQQDRALRTSSILMKRY